MLSAFRSLLLLLLLVGAAFADEAKIASPAQDADRLSRLFNARISAALRAIQVSMKPRLDGKVILIDAGHGGRDSGACRLGIREKDITLRMAKQLKRVFEERGATVYLTRDKDIDLELEDICAITEKVKPDVFLSLHVNSSPGETKVSGLQTYFRTDHSRMLAHTVHATVIAKGTCADRRVFSGSLWVLRSPTIPSLLIESGYINCRFDRKRLLDSRYRLKLCDGIADGVTAFWQKKGLLKRKHA
jgi:N-acetylmuramoyl-L-alanine amidase